MVEVKRTVLFVFYAAILTLPAVATGGPPNPQDKDELAVYMKADEKYQEGLKYLSQENYDQAKESLQEALQALPIHSDAAYNLGVALYQTQDYQTALSHIDSAIQNYPQWHDHEYEMKTAYYHYAQARIIEIENQMRQLLGDAAYHQYKSGGLKGLHSVPKEDAARILELQRSLTDMKEVLLPKQKAMQTPAGYYFQAGNCYLRMQKYDEAHRCYLQAVETNPNHGDAHNNLAFIYFLAKQYEKSWEHLQKAEQCGVKINPQVKEQLKKAMEK